MYLFFEIKIVVAQHSESAQTDTKVTNKAGSSKEMVEGLIDLEHRTDSGAEP